MAAEIEDVNQTHGDGVDDTANNSGQRTCCYAQMEPNITKMNLTAFYLVSALTIAQAVALGGVQPFLLLTFCGLPFLEQGVVAGRATFIGELVSVLTVGPWGVLADKITRRPVFVVSSVLMAIGWAVLPFSYSAASYIALRCVLEIGLTGAGCMVSIILADYVKETHRGKATGVQGITTGCGAAAGALLFSRLPTWWAAAGVKSPNGYAEGWATYLSLAALALFVAFCGAVGLARERRAKPRAPCPDTELETASAEQVENSIGPQSDKPDFCEFFDNLKDGGKAACVYKGVGMAYLTAFVVRTNQAFTGTFIAQWCTSYLIKTSQEAAAAAGSTLTTEQLVELGKQGIAQGGSLIAVIGATSLVAAPLYGLFGDRFKRSTVLGFSLLVNALGYGLTIVVENPVGTKAYAVCGLIGVGSVASILSAQVFVQMVSPVEKRGVILGAYGAWGGIGVMINSLIGGELFVLLFQGPFLWLCFLNVLLASFLLIYARCTNFEQNFAYASVKKNEQVELELLDGGEDKRHSEEWDTHTEGEDKRADEEVELHVH